MKIVDCPYESIVSLGARSYSTGSPCSTIARMPYIEHPKRSFGGQSKSSPTLCIVHLCLPA